MKQDVMKQDAMKQSAKKRFAVLIVVACLAVGALGVIFTKGGVSDAEIAAEPYVGYPSFPELTNFHFMETSYQQRVAQGDNPLLVFGSSELDISRDYSSSHMATLFGENNYGFDVMAMGRGFVNDMYNVVEIGALSSQIKGKKLVLIPSMQWFMTYKDETQQFPSCFSGGAYQAFMDSPNVSDDIKQQATELMASHYHVDRVTNGSALMGLINRANDALGQEASEIRLGFDLSNAQALGSDFVRSVPQELTDVQRSHASGATETPDWSSIFADATQETQDSTTSNPYGFYDKWYNKKTNSFTWWIWDAQRHWSFRDGQPFDEGEFEAFELTLKECQEQGIHPLVILQPVKAFLYDQTIYNKDVRATWYERMRELCEKYGAQVADFSSHEDDKLFFYDNVHPSALGDAYYAQAVYEYYYDQPLTQGAN